MTRTAHPDTIAAAHATNVSPFTAVELDYPGGAVRLCSLPLQVAFGGLTFYGTGAMGEISALEEGGENRSYGFSLSLSGIPGNWLDYLRSQDVQGRMVRVWLGFVDAKHTIIGEPQIIAVGRMDTQDVRAGKTTSVTVSCESIAVDWERARVSYVTDVDQQAKYPGDRIFEYVAAMENLTLTWGKA